MNITQYANTGYEALFVALTVPLIAQTIKFSLHLIFDKKIDISLNQCYFHRILINAKETLINNPFLNIKQTDSYNSFKLS